MNKLKVTTIEAGHFTDIKKLTGKENLKERYMLYNDILFKEIKDLAKSIIIINEKGTGGIIIAKEQYANKALYKLKNDNKDKNIEVLRKSTNSYGITKLALVIEEKNKYEGFKI